MYNQLLNKGTNTSCNSDMYVRSSLKHLWRAVLKCTTKIVKELSWSHHGSRAKVNESNVETSVNDYIFIFYVPVKDVLSPQVKHSCHQLRKTQKLSLNKERISISLHGSVPCPLSYAISPSCTYLSKYIASQGLIQSWLHVYEFKKVQAISMFLHHHLKITPILKHLQHLVEYTK